MVMIQRYYVLDPMNHYIGPIEFIIIFLFLKSYVYKFFTP